MKSFILTTHPCRLYARIPSSTTKNLKTLLIRRKPNWPNSFFLNFRSQSSHFAVSCSSRASDRGLEKIQKEVSDEAIVEDENIQNEVGNPIIPLFASPLPKLSLSDQAFFLLAFIACTTSVAFTSLVFAAVPTLFAMRNAAISLSKLADTAREELPSTMAAIRLSGMEISDLTLELSDLSQEIADGISKSAQALQAAESGVRQISTLAHQKTISMIEERANLPIISLQPVVAGAARKTSRAVGRATKTIINIISGREGGIKNDDNSVQF